MLFQFIKILNSLSITSRLKKLPPGLVFHQFKCPDKADTAGLAYKRMLRQLED